MKLYDENGKVIEYEADKPAYFGLNSLNRNDDPTPPVIEKFSNTNMKFIGITGSLVSEHADGIYSNSQTFSVGVDGKTLNSSDWDSPNSPYMYIGAGLGRNS